MTFLLQMRVTAYVTIIILLTNEACSQATTDTEPPVHDNLLNERLLRIENALNVCLKKDQHEDSQSYHCENDDNTDTDCANGFFKIGCSCYSIIEEDKTWVEANHHCRYVLNSHLVIVEDLQELNELRRVIGTEYVNLWVGAFRRHDGGFYWESCARTDEGGDRCTFTAVKRELWYPGQPDNHEEMEPWAEMSKGYNYLLNDTDEDLEQDFICEYEL